MAEYEKKYAKFSLKTAVSFRGMEKETMISGTVQLQIAILQLTAKLNHGIPPTKS